MKIDGFELGDAYIFVVFDGGTVKKYLTEEKAVIDINLREKQASDIKAVIIGNELGMATSNVKRLHCFKKAERPKKKD